MSEQVTQTISREEALARPRWSWSLRKLLAFGGPGFLVAVGYMDPGNWATDLAAGSRFNYTLLSVVFISNLLAILLQSLSLRLGIVTGRDLAQSCRDSFSRPATYLLWFGAEIAIAACDLAEVIGSAIALQLLFHIPLLMGVIITAADVLIILVVRQMRFIEGLIVTLMAVIFACFAYEIILSNPQWGAVLHNMLVPSTHIWSNREMLYIAVGILGATVMPHNLYLHSALVKSRQFEPTAAGKREALRLANWDSAIALSLALFVNAAILIVAAATFHRTGHHDVAEIADAYKLLAPLLGVGAASTLFAVALLASGQNSTLTGTLAGQIVMEGFLDIRMRPWLRRLLTRGVAILPAIITIALYGEGSISRLLIFSQVILSMQLSFAVVPLVMFTSDPKRMAEFRNSTLILILAWISAVLIAGLNLWLIWQAVGASS
jgi:manganese transport protein